MTARRSVMLLLVAALLGAPSALVAQGSSAIGVAAEISTTALTVAQIRDVLFGNVVPGAPTAIDGRNPSAGEFQLNGNRNAEVSVTMTLPAVLSTGFWTMPISFGATSGCWRRLAGQAQCTFWDPTTVLIERIRNSAPPNNRLFIWIGGTVSPSPTQTPGVYLGTITLTVAYTGN